MGQFIAGLTFYQIAGFFIIVGLFAYGFVVHDKKSSGSSSTSSAPKDSGPDNNA